jgi:hypothetical protein
MPTLREWRHILHRAIAMDLSDDGEAPFPVYPFATKDIEVTPCVVLQQGGQGTYLDPNGEARTVCLVTGTITAHLVVGDALTEQAADVLDDLAYLLYAGGLKACRSDELNPDGHVPVLGALSDPGVTPLGGGEFWSASVPISVPVHRK